MKMSILMKRTLVAVAVIILCILVLFFVTDSYLKTHYLLLTNQSEKSVCVQSDSFVSETVKSNQTIKVKFRVKGDGSFTITNCDKAITSQRIGYFTTNYPRCHLVEYDDGNKFFYESTKVKECRRVE